MIFQRCDNGNQCYGLRGEKAVAVKVTNTLLGSKGGKGRQLKLIEDKQYADRHYTNCTKMEIEAEKC